MAFCRSIGVNYKKITYAHPCWYIEYLARYNYTAGAISNNVSHLRTYYRLAGLDPAPLNHYRVGLALRAIAMNIRQPKVDKLPVSPTVLRAALAYIRQGPDALPLSLAVILMFLGFLRQSSVAPPTVKTFDPTRHLTRADVCPGPRGLAINIKWSKTIQSAAAQKSILIPHTKDPLLCPVKAYAAYVASNPVASPRAPLLAFSDGNPLTTRYIARRWTAALKSAGFSPSTYTLHSLRKGGASFAYNHGKADLNDVKAQGTWKSDAVRSYIKPMDAEPNTVHEALSAL